MRDRNYGGDFRETHFIIVAILRAARNSASIERWSQAAAWKGPPLFERPFVPRHVCRDAASPGLGVLGYRRRVWHLSVFDPFHRQIRDS